LIYIYQNKNYLEEEERDYLVQYYHVKDIEEGSPLKLALKFLDDFTDNLDYDSPFFYPLLSIDGGIYYYKYNQKNGDNTFLKTYGFDMYSLATIKNHLKNLIPNIIVKDENGGDEDAQTNYTVGIISLNINQISNYGIKDIDKYNKNNNNKHFGFVLSRILLHELYGHKKSSFSKNGLIKYSPTVFKDIDENIRYLSTIFGEEIYKSIDDINLKEKSEREKEGDSGFFLEYFFGKINCKYTTEIIDKLIKNRIDLSVLLDINLWHKKIETLKDYVKYKYFINEKYQNTSPLLNLDINEQIKEMKNLIFKNEKSDNIEDIIEKFYTPIQTHNTDTDNHSTKIKKDDYPGIKKRFFKI